MWIFRNAESDKADVVLKKLNDTAQNINRPREAALDSEQIKFLSELTGRQAFNLSRSGKKLTMELFEAKLFEFHGDVSFLFYLPLASCCFDSCLF